jgi:hypothetical protein
MMRLILEVKSWSLGGHIHHSNLTVLASQALVVNHKARRVDHNLFDDFNLGRRGARIGKAGSLAAQ